MVKILSADQIREWDEFTIRQEPVSSIDLMERASRRFTEHFLQRYQSYTRILVVCGVGNNGGDGLAIARMLFDYGFKVDVFVFGNPASGRTEFKINLERLPLVPVYINENNSIPETDAEVIVDALFGIGLNKPLNEFYNLVISWINTRSAIRVSVDMPSGLTCDGRAMGEVVHADSILSFQVPKLAFLLPQNDRFVGEWELTDIGLAPAFLDRITTRYSILTRQDISTLLRKRQIFDHKGVYGHVLLCGGQKGMIGAMVLATQAAMRSGVGKITCNIPAIGSDVLQSTSPEAMCKIDPAQDFLTVVPDLSAYSAIGIGPGLGTHPLTLTYLQSLLEQARVPLVLDADALNLLAGNPDLLATLPPGSILTPHPGEFARFIGKATDDLDRLMQLHDFALKTQCWVVLKGAYTAICSPVGNIRFNPSGNPGMAKGGSGDVLTGLLASIMAIGYPPEAAIPLAVYIHGHAGDLAAAEFGMESMTPSNLISKIPAAFKNLG